MTDLLVLCTGNAARSVMAGFMLEPSGTAAPIRSTSSRRAPM